TRQMLLLESEDTAGFLRDFPRWLARQLSRRGADRWRPGTLLRYRRAATALSSDAQRRALGALQHRSTHCPCMTAIRENTVTRAGDLRDDGRWPEYGAAAVDQGVRAVLGVPFDLDEDAQAGLNVYSATPHDFDPGTVDSIVLE